MEEKLKEKRIDKHRTEKSERAGSVAYCVSNRCGSPGR
jgi:hypothetical protein